MLLSLTVEQTDLLCDALFKLALDERIDDTERARCVNLAAKIEFDQPPILMFDTGQENLIKKAFYRDYTSFRNKYETLANNAADSACVNNMQYQKIRRQLNEMQKEFKVYMAAAEKLNNNLCATYSTKIGR